MKLEALKNADRVIGIKQVTKAVKKGNALCVFIADDADERVTDGLRSLCQENNVDVTPVETMKELGNACVIEVGAAAAAALR